MDPIDEGALVGNGSLGGIVALGQSAIPAEWRQRREPPATMLRLTRP